MTLTTEALIRALRTHMHRMAEDIEAGYARSASQPGSVGNRESRRLTMRVADDDVSGD